MKRRKTVQRPIAAEVQLLESLQLTRTMVHGSFLQTMDRLGVVLQSPTRRPYCLPQI